MNAAAHYRAFSFIVPKNGNLSKFHFRTGTVTTGDTLHISFQDANADGSPDGVADEYRTLVVGSGDDEAWLTTGIMSSDGTDLGTKRAVTEGQRVCVVMRFDSFVAGSMWLQYFSSSGVASNFLLSSTDSGSTWAHVAGSGFACAVEYDDGTFAYLDGAYPIKSITTTSVNTTSTPDEYSLRFRLPFPVRALGVVIRAASTDTEFGLYPDSGAALATKVPLVAATTLDKRAVHFSSAIDLAANTWYRISWKPTTTTNRSIPVYTLNSAAIREAFALGLNFSLGTRSDGGSWTDDDTKFILASLLAVGFDDGSGGGGGSCSYGALSNGTRVVPVAQ